MMEVILPFLVRFYLGCIVVGVFWSWVDALIIDRVIAPQAKDVLVEARKAIKQLMK